MATPPFENREGWGSRQSNQAEWSSSGVGRAVNVGWRCGKAQPSNGETQVTIPDQLKREIVDDARRLSRGGARLETILVFLREKGFDKIDSIVAIQTLQGRTLNEAKQLIDRSDAWSDRFNSDMEFREAAWKVLRDMAASQDPSLQRSSSTSATRRSRVKTRLCTPAFAHVKRRQVSVTPSPV